MEKSFHKRPWKIMRVADFFGFTWWSTFGTFYKLAGLFIL